MAVLLCLMAGPAVSAAQDDPERELDEAKALYRSGRLDEALDALRSVIGKINALRDLQSRRIQLADAHLHLGLTYLALRNEPVALENFRQTAALDPNRRLDPEIYSPRVVGLYDRARAEVDADRPDDRAGEAAIAGETRADPPEPPPPAIRDALNALQPGARVRVQIGDGGIVRGSLLSLSDRTFTLTNVANQTVEFPREQLTKVEVVTGRRRHTLQFGLVGLGLGAVMGAIDPPGCDPDGTCWTRAENIGYTSIGTGMIGALIGALYRTEQWVEVPVDSLTIRAVPGGSGLAVSLSW
jgi:hypothetical protein